MCACVCAGVDYRIAPETFLEMICYVGEQRNGAIVGKLIRI